MQVKHDCASTKGQSGASMYDSDYRVRAIITAGSDSQNYAIQASACPALWCSIN